MAPSVDPEKVRDAVKKTAKGREELLVDSLRAKKFRLDAAWAFIGAAALEENHELFTKALQRAGSDARNLAEEIGSLLETMK